MGASLPPCIPEKSPIPLFLLKDMGRHGTQLDFSVLGLCGGSHSSPSLLSPKRNLETQPAECFLHEFMTWQDRKGSLYEQGHSDTMTQITEVTPGSCPCYLGQPSLSRSKQWMLLALPVCG